MSSKETTQKLIDKYYSIAPLELLEDLRNRLQNLHTPIKERNELLNKHSTLFSQLEELFKQIILERNKLAKKSGFTNYFSFATDWYGIPTVELNSFFDLHSKLSEKIINNIVQLKKIDKDYWSEYNNPTTANIIESDINFHLPDCVYDYFEKKVVNFNSLKKRIKLVEVKDRYFYTNYNKADGSVEIRGYLNSKSSISTIAFAQEVGHAIEFITLMDNNEDPDDKSSYWHEEKAIKYELLYENALPKEIIDANRDRVLYHFALSLFEKYIYEIPTRDFARVFAQVHNQVYPSDQKSNPFYLLNYFLIDMPCYSAIYSSVYTKYLKNYYL